MIVNRFTHSRMVNDEVVGVLLALGVFVINVWAGVVVNTLSGVLVAVTIDFVSNIDLGEVLADVNANVLLVAMTALPFAMSAS